MILDVVINNGCIYYAPYTRKCTGTVSLPHISNIVSLVGQLDTTPSTYEYNFKVSILREASVEMVMDYTHTWMPCECKQHDPLSD